VAGLLVSLLAAASCASGGSAAGMPDVVLPAASGTDSLNPAELREPTLINLWATWCIPCKRELPDLERIHSDPTNAARIIGVNVGDDEASVRKYINDLGLTFEQYIDLDGIVESALRVSTLPATAVIGADGRLIEVHQGVLDEAGFRALIEKAG